MKAFWKQQARRINALSLRERVIMFASLAVALGALADVLVLTPQMNAQKAMTSQLRQQNTELDGLRAQLASLWSPCAANTPLARLQRNLAETRRQRTGLDAELKLRSSVEGGAARLPELLERVLKRHERLTLLRLATATPPVTPTAMPTATPPRESKAAGPALQGVDLQVSGNYNDLVLYLAEIETAMPGLRWSELQLSSQTQPPVLKVRVYLQAETGAPS
jgi:MSHA biogenesis protein MshJ